jgi:hypothetical protein
MKSSFLPLVLILLSGLIVNSCTVDDSDDGPYVDPRVKFLGDWSVNNEDCSKSRYIVTISEDPSNSSQVLLFNFGFSQTAEPDTAIVAGSTITLPDQVNSEKWEVSGIGKYEDPDKISWTYSLYISGDLQSCTATYVKQ